MARNRPKISHTQGVVARVEWKSTDDHEYTGLFSEGSTHAILRFSETANLNPASTGLIPSMAVKFLVDNYRSKNILAMPSFNNSGSWNFFKKPMSNRVDPWTRGPDIADHEGEEFTCEVNTMLKKMVESAQRPFATALGHVAMCYNNGECSKDKDLINVPYEVKFTTHHQFPDKEQYDDQGEQVMFYDQLKSIPFFEPDSEGNLPDGESNHLMEAWALTAPIKLGGEWVKIADINLMSPLYTSNFADTRLYFQHRKINRDRKYWPWAWRNEDEDPKFDRHNPDNMWPAKNNYLPPGVVWPEDREEAKDLYTEQISEHGCPFAWLLGLE